MLSRIFLFLRTVIVVQVFLRGFKVKICCIIKRIFILVLLAVTDIEVFVF